MKEDKLGNLSMELSVNVEKRGIMKKVIAIVIVLILFFVFGIALFIYTRPVAWDAGACSGGYATYIFNKYNDVLTQEYLIYKGIDKESIEDIETVSDSQSVIWEGKNIFIKYDIKYKNPENGITTENVSFVGKRIWIDTFKWSKNK